MKSTHAQPNVVSLELNFFARREDFSGADPLVGFPEVIRPAARARPRGRAQTRASAPQTTDQIWLRPH